MISLRTLVNTTIFWFLVVSVFWGYTRWIDNTPAKELLHTIGWDNLGNLTITTDQGGFSNNNQDLLLRKLDNMESMIKATNMNCSLIQVNSEKNIAPLPTPNSPQDNTISSQSNNRQVIDIPVFDMKKNNQLPKKEQATVSALSSVQRQVATESPTIDDIFDMIRNIKLTPQETTQGLINVFENTPISIQTSSLKNGILMISLSNIDSLSSSELNLVTSILEKTYSQFTDISSVIIQP